MDSKDKQGILTNARYFFQWMGELFRTWFLPYHYDENDEDRPPVATEAEPDRMPKPSAPPEEPAEEPVSSVADPFAESKTQANLPEFLAFRGPMTANQVSNAVGEDRETVAAELERLVETHQVEAVDADRYKLVDSERRQILRTHPDMADWLSRLGRAQLENDVLDVIEEIGRKLPVKINAGKSVVFHLRQRKWMVWQNQEETCRVRLFGSHSREQWSTVRSLDSRARQFRRKGAHRWDGRDWVLFRWQEGSDIFAIESLLLESGREFQKHARRRRGGGRRRSRSRVSDDSPLMK
jgi:hypothetical protein